MTASDQDDFAHLWGADRDLQYQAFQHILAVTEQPAGWAYDVWDEVVADLGHRDHHNRAIAARVLGHLAKSDPQRRVLRDFDALLAVTKEERFVTARHCLQALWHASGGRGRIAAASVSGGGAGRSFQGVRRREERHPDPL